MKTLSAVIIIGLVCLMTLSVFFSQVKAQFVFEKQLTFNSADDSNPCLSPDGTKIAFESNRDGDDEIFVIDVDGQNEKQLTSNNVHDGFPTFSPDGSKIAYQSSGGIFIINVDGSGLTQLTFEYDLLPKFSPDGSRIVFDSARDGDREIFVVNLDGSGLKQLTFNTETDNLASFSPDGTMIVYVSFSDGDSEIWIMNADGTNQRQLTSNTQYDFFPTFSPDGSRIAFDSSRDGDLEIFTMDVDGTGQTQLTYNEAADIYSRFSPSGSEIMFMSDRDGDYEIFTMNYDGTSQTQLTFNTATMDIGEDFTPDESKIMFWSDRDGDFELFLGFLPSVEYNEPPIADFRYRGPKTSFTPSTIYAGSKVKFDAEPSYDPDGTIVSYSWNFGDGTPVTETDVVTYHIYPISGPYTVTLTVTDHKGATASIAKNIFINPLKWELYFEIDYMTGHEPTDSVLEYIHGYFRDNGIYVYFFVDDEISPADTRVTENEFWAYEMQFNDAIRFDDRASDGQQPREHPKLDLKEKWILFGTEFDSSWRRSTTLGMTYVWNETGSKVHADFGNYIFIADQSSDDYADQDPEMISEGATKEEVETVVLMHEIGHAVGIYRAFKDPRARAWVEFYDPNHWSVMARLTPWNCNMEPIRYSKPYWNLRNMEYYII